MTASSSGKLILAANSLGRPEDIPLRSLEILRTADLLLFEEPRGARQALKAAGIHREFHKYSEHKEQATLALVEDALRRGHTVAYMSDQGMPVLADPGHGLLQLAERVSAHVEVIPGPSSITAALAACPFYRGPFFYQGFLERDPARRREQLVEIQERNWPTLILETPYRRQALCDACSDTMPNDRQAFLALDITGDNEQYVRTSCGRLAQISRDLPPKLNFVLILSGK